MTSALRIRPRRLALTSPLNLRQRSSRFYPPHCYQASQAGTSSLLRRHLPPRPRLCLGSHLDHRLPYAGYGVRLPRLLHRLPVNDATLKHSTGLTEYRASRYFARLPTCAAEAGSLALCTVDLLWLPSDLTVGQWRPCQSDYLPPSRGDATFFQVTGFAGFAGQTKKGGP